MVTTDLLNNDAMKVAYTANIVDRDLKVIMLPLRNKRSTLGYPSAGNIINSVKIERPG